MKFFEIDFLEAGNNCSGDAISVRYANDEEEFVHIIDGGYTEDGQELIDHIRKYYGNPGFIDHVVLTHPDRDHGTGLKKVLEEFDIGTLWMNRPWNHIPTLLPLFDYDYTETGLIQRLKKDFPLTAALEKIAEEKDITIKDAFQGNRIGAFTVLAPSVGRYISLIVDFEKTPKPAQKVATEGNIFERAITLIKNAVVEWGEENLKGHTEGTSRKNEMSIIQYAVLCDEKILMTGDAGVEALEEAYNYAIGIGIDLPGIDRFQVPHHGSRRNLSPDILDKWLGPKLAEPSETTSTKAFISANQNDENHPRKAVIRALVHRGAKVFQAKGPLQTQKYAPKREDWFSMAPLDYPTEMEE